MNKVGAYSYNRRDYSDFLNLVYEEKPMLRLRRSDVVVMFESLGMKTAGSWNKQRMTEKIATLENSYDADQKLPSKSTQATFDSIFSAKVNDVGIELVSDDVDIEEKEGVVKGEERETEEVTEEETKVAEAKSMGVRRNAKTAAYFVGRTLAEFGVEGGVTEDMCKRLDVLRNKSKPEEAAASLAWGWHVIHGYLEGVDGGIATKKEALVE